MIDVVSNMKPKSKYIRILIIFGIPLVWPVSLVILLVGSIGFLGLIELKKLPAVLKDDFGEEKEEIIIDGKMRIQKFKVVEDSILLVYSIEVKKADIKPSPDATPDFSDVEIIDGGNAIRFGKYEAAADSFYE